MSQSTDLSEYEFLAEEYTTAPPPTVEETTRGRPHAKGIFQHSFVSTYVSFTCERLKVINGKSKETMNSHVIQDQFSATTIPRFFSLIVGDIGTKLE
jgi:hypothetical protein